MARSMAGGGFQVWTERGTEVFDRSGNRRGVGPAALGYRD